MNEQHLHYSMYIEWSDEDQAFLVTLPEWADRVFMPATHGSTYAEAVKHGQEVLQLLVNSAKQNREPLPSPKIRVAWHSQKSTQMTQTPQSASNQQKAQVQDYFSRNAEAYVASFSHRSGDDLRRLVEIGEWSADQWALDIATGGGHTALAVAPHVATITVTDLTPHMLEKAREFLLSQGVANAVFQVADAEALPFAAESFDRVTCRIAPHHFPDVAQFVREVARVLKSGGIFLLIDCMAPSDAELDTFDNRVEKWRDPSHGRSCTVEEWQAFLKEADLKIEDIEFFRKAHMYDEWTTRSQMAADEKERLAKFIRESNEHIRSHFEVKQNQDGQLESFTNDFIFLKARKG